MCSYLDAQADIPPEKIAPAPPITGWVVPDPLTHSDPVGLCILMYYHGISFRGPQKLATRHTVYASSFCRVQAHSVFQRDDVTGEL
jgi:hypothetical protein